MVERERRGQDTPRRSSRCYDKKLSLPATRRIHNRSTSLGARWFWGFDFFSCEIRLRKRGAILSSAFRTCSSMRSRCGGALLKTELGQAWMAVNGGQGIRPAIMCLSVRQGLPRHLAQAPSIPTPVLPADHDRLWTRHSFAAIDAETHDKPYEALIPFFISSPFFGHLCTRA